MSYRTHWTSVDQISVETMPESEVPSVTDTMENEPDVLVLFDHGNQEGLVIGGDPDEWEHLANLILTRVRFYREGRTDGETRTGEES